MSLKLCNDEICMMQVALNTINEIETLQILMVGRIIDVIKICYYRNKTLAH